MANQEKRPNSGSSLSRPSLMLPYLLRPKYRAKTMKIATTSMYHQPSALTIQSWAVVRTVPVASGRAIALIVMTAVMMSEGQNTRGVMKPRPIFTPCARS